MEVILQLFDKRSGVSFLLTSDSVLIGGPVAYHTIDLGGQMLKSLIGVLTMTLSFQAIAWSAHSRRNGFCLPTQEDLGKAIRNQQGAVKTSDEVKDWPICGIYMHGLFGTSKYPESRWEKPFRQNLNQIALEKNCRIAVPIGNKGNNWNWNGLSLGEVRKRALAVCGEGAYLSEDLSLIGFSNGANVIASSGAAKCSSLSAFSQVILVGPNHSPRVNRARSCGRVTVHVEHIVPHRSNLGKHFASHGRQPDSAWRGSQKVK